MKEVTQRYVAVAICDLIQGSGKVDGMIKLTMKREKNLNDPFRYQ